MTHVTASTTEAAEGELPLDIGTMRESARRLLDETIPPPTEEELATLTALLRDHIEQLTPEVAVACLRLPKDDAPRACAQACLGEARMRLRLGEGDTLEVRQSIAVKLARSVRALCDHYENLSAPACR